MIAARGGQHYPPTEGAPLLAETALAGAVVGALSGVVVVVLQDASAWVARMLWGIDSPWLNVFLYSLLGAAGGALAAPALEIVRRAVAPRLPGWTWAATWLGLGAYAAMTVGWAGRRLISGGRLTRPLVQIAVLLVLATITMALLSRRRPRSIRPAITDALCLMLPTVTLQYLTLAVLLSGRFQRLALGLTGRRALATVAAAGLAGILLGVMFRSRPGNGQRKHASTSRLVATAILLAVAGAGLWAQRAPRTTLAPGPPPQGPNVLLVVLDTLRRDAVSAYGVLDGITPNLDAFAAEGVLWLDALNPANWTVPAHASLFTGAQVTRHGTGDQRWILRELPGGPSTLPLPTLAEIFLRHGWQTVGFSCNGFLNHSYGFDRGFSEYYEVWRARQGSYDMLARALGKRFPLGTNDRGGNRTIRGLADWWRGKAEPGRPWFAFVNMTEPHSPYDVPHPWHGRFLDAEMTRAETVRFAKQTHRYKYGGAPPEVTERLWQLYLGAVAYQDHLVGRMLAELAEAGLADDTIVVITSDHGENFGWRGQLFHGAALNDDLIRIPMMARGPGIPAGVRDASPVSLIDIFPTLLQLSGIPQLPPDPGRPGLILPPIGEPVVDGRPRVAERYADYLTDPSEFTRRRPTVDTGWAPEQSALLEGPWKVMDRDGGHGSSLTRLEGEPRPPQTDGRIAVRDGERITRMLERLSELRTSWPRAIEPSPDGSPQLDDETESQLEALGYID